MSPTTTFAILNARVWTGDRRRPWADAVLVQGDCIALVGSSAEVRKRMDATGRVIDARGRFVLRGLGKDHVARPGRDSVAALHAAINDTLSEAWLLGPGAPADLVMIDRDLTRMSPEDLGDTQVVLIIESGEIVLDRSDVT
jgi:predicted amidohydrolase YtcJ